MGFKPIKLFQYSIPPLLLPHHFQAHHHCHAPLFKLKQATPFHIKVGLAEEDAKKYIFFGVLRIIKVTGSMITYAHSPHHFLSVLYRLSS